MSGKLLLTASLVIHSVYHHYLFRPVDVIPLLQIVRTEKTSLQVIVDLIDVGQKIGKTPVVVGNTLLIAGHEMPPRETRDVVPAEELPSLQDQEKPMGKLTDKSNVYAFGTILLELLWGRKVADGIVIDILIMHGHPGRTIGSKWGFDVSMTKAVDGGYLFLVLVQILSP
ncbi:hypothetical protein POM88_001816 [Heracleum sosnowskyi]|uniref:3-hydroxyacyl-CoA dehydrogenase NAD binding domain-containing protein n=1 Tax=Heracleum sosnowskyi TaxID=360622 RepID=A0AAD8NB84_9APIA|nr:hypothetical protein POM88_001816 [Heracleum sosnowskyi]